MQSFDSYGDVKSGFWGVLAHKAREILEDDITSQHHEYLTSQRLKLHSFNTFTQGARAEVRD